MITSFDVKVDTLNLNLLELNVLEPEVVERALKALNEQDRKITLTFSMNMDQRDLLNITHVNGYPVVQNDYVSLINSCIVDYE